VSSTTLSSAHEDDSVILRVNDTCEALYHEDGEWYSARITKVVSDNQFQVLFIDYGNEEIVKRGEIRDIVSISDLIQPSTNNDNNDNDYDNNIDNDNSSSSSSTHKLLTAPIRMGDAFESGKKVPMSKAEKQADKALLKLSAKRQARLERTLEQEKIRKTWNPHRHQIQLKNALPIYLSSQHLARTSSKDINIEDCQLLAPDNTELLSNTTFKLVYGRRYGLLGRNGIGKSTLLRAIASYDLRGFPTFLKVMHVEQEVVGDSTSVIQTVLSADFERSLLLEEERQLTQAAQSSTAVDAATTSANAARLSVIYERLNAIDAYTAESRAATILSGLAFTPEMQQMPTSHLSGGWRMRVSLASALFVSPDVLLLDEPTNHLDFPTVLWLERYLREYPKTVLTVSHDRTFLNNVVTDVILFTNNCSLVYYRGDYDNYVRVREEQLIADRRAYAAQEAKRAHIQEFIDTFRTEKKCAAQDRKVGQVMSRIKLLEKLEKEAMPDPDNEMNADKFSLSFPDPGKLRSPVLVEVKNLNFRYDLSNTKRDIHTHSKSYLLEDVSVRVEITSRIGVLGANGCGKSTLIKLIIGELTPIDGIITINSMNIAVFNQHHVDSLNLGLTSVEYLQEKFPGLKEQDYRRHLGNFGIRDDLSMMQIGNLSGGQKSRLVFSILTWKQPHLLILDEPTNHLDMDTIDELIKAVITFKGAVLLVSHDQYFLSKTCKQYWAVSSGRVFVSDSLEHCKKFSYKL